MDQTVPASTDCPESALIHSDLYVRTLHRACEVMGGIAALAVELKLRPLTVNRMLLGKVAVPMSVFFDAVDSLLRPLT